MLPMDMSPTSATPAAPAETDHRTANPSDCAKNLRRSPGRR
jgi:hypothetical protein